MTRVAWGFALILAAPALLIALPYAWLLIQPLLVPAPPNCQDGPCPWLPEYGPAPFFAREELIIALWVGIPSLTVLVGLGLLLSALVRRLRRLY